MYDTKFVVPMLIFVVSWGAVILNLVLFLIMLNNYGISNIFTLILLAVLIFSLWKQYKVFRFGGYKHLKGTNLKDLEKWYK
jgi:hypothetical protein